MKRLLLLSAFLISLFIFAAVGIYFSIHRIVFPNTYLSRLSVSGNSKNDTEKLLIEIVQSPIRLRVKNRVYEYRYSDLGILLNVKSTLDTIFEPNKKSFPVVLGSYVKSLRSQTMLLPTLMFSHDFYQFTKDSIFDFSEKQDEVMVDDETKQLVFKDNEEKYLIDPQNLKEQIVLNFGKKNTIIQPLLIQLDNEVKNKVISHNQILRSVFNSPVYFIVQDEESPTRITLPGDQLRMLVTMDYKRNDDIFEISLDESKFQTLITNLLSPLKMNPDKKISQENLKRDLISVLHERSTGIKSDSVLTKIQFMPNTSGEKEKKYIEVDLSQQTMYLFKDGQLNQTYKISTGLYYPTPVGEFKIMNKATNAFSDIYNVWMPYWMAFYYSSHLNASFGIHELPYWVTQDGKKMQRPREFIGSPHTGGCVALDIGAAKEVYAFADIGTPVYVFN